MEKRNYRLEGLKYGEKGDYDKALELFNKAADHGDVYAINDMGVCYQRQGEFVLARMYYNIAAINGVGIAYVNLGDLFKNGLGCEKDYKLAISYYKKATEHDCADGYYNLAMMALNGVGMKQDNKLMEKYLKKGAKLQIKNKKDKGYGCVMEYGYNLASGEVIKENVGKAIRLYKKALYKEEGGLYYNLACLYVFEKKYKNLRKGVEYLNKAADKDYLDAFNMLGSIYKKGEVIEQDLNLAEHYWKMGANKGSDKCVANYIESSLANNTKRYFVRKLGIGLLYKLVDKACVNEDECEKETIEIYQDIKKTLKEEVDFEALEIARKEKKIRETVIA